MVTFIPTFRQALLEKIDGRKHFFEGIQIAGIVAFRNRKFNLSWLIWILSDKVHPNKEDIP
jgi:hypothetical protein